MFPTWRDEWMRFDAIPSLLAKADVLLARRFAGAVQKREPCMPGDSSDLALAISGLGCWANGSPPASLEDRPQIIRRIQTIVQPVLKTAALSRWLLLERAFLDGSATGDLLFAALTLRTMCEELQRLSALDMDPEQLAQIAASGNSEDQKRLLLYVAFASVSLDAIPQDMVLLGTDWPSLRGVQKASPQLDSARSALNAYVHPNYGSHIAALYPECTNAAQILLEAVVAVYETFFAVSWLQGFLVDPATASAIATWEPWPQIAQRFLSTVLPGLQRKATVPTQIEALGCRAVVEWISDAPATCAAMLCNSDSETLFDGLPRNRAGGSDEPKGSNRFKLWDGARAHDVISFAVARIAEGKLAAEFPLGAPESSDQCRWLSFNSLALQLAVLLDQSKAGAFKTQLVRQITQANSIGIILCVRSLIEHRALVVWLTREVSSALNALGNEARAGDPLPPTAAQVAQPLANFLATQAKTTGEDQRSWIMLECGGVRNAWLNLDNIVNVAFSEEDRFRTFYALASAVMHGRSIRGVDLLRDAEGVTTSASHIGLLVLDRLCDREEEMDHLAAGLRIFTQLNHAAQFGGTTHAATDSQARKVFGQIGTLVANADFTGDGTQERPFKFRSHVQIHEASCALLEQLGIDVTVCRRELERGDGGILCDRWYAPEREYWFEVRPASSTLGVL